MRLSGVVRADAIRYASTVRGALRHPGFRMTLRWRVAKALHERGIPLAPQLLRQSIVTSYSCDWSLAAELGPGLRVPHPLGIVIGNQAIVGPGAVVMHGVTIGGNRGRTIHGRGMPTIGENVEIGPYAQVLGPVLVTSNAQINAGAVISRDLGSNASEA